MKKNKKRLFTVLSILILVVCLFLAYVVLHKPKVAPVEVKKRPTLVSVIETKEGNYNAIVNALGQVIPSMKVTLKAEVSGKIVYVSDNFVPGGIIKKGETILKIEDKDYKIAYQKALAAYNSARASYSEAMGKQSQAEKEFDMYTKTTGEKIKNPYLILRKPELEQAKANLEQAKAELEQAKTNLERTDVKAPFNSIIYDKIASFGSVISLQEEIATLVNTDSYWLEVSVPIGNLKFIDFTNPANAKVTLNMSNGRGTREATIYKLLNYLDTKARFVNILMVIDDPLLLNTEDIEGKPKVLLDDYVNVNIEGKPINNVFRIPLYTVKNNNVVWIIENNKLKFVPVNVIYQDKNYAYVTGLKKGSLVITSDLSIPIEGMDLKVASNNN